MASDTGTSAVALVDVDSSTLAPTREADGDRMGLGRVEESLSGDASCEGT